MEIRGSILQGPQEGFVSWDYVKKNPGVYRAYYQNGQEPDTHRVIVSFKDEVQLLVFEDGSVLPPRGGWDQEGTVFKPYPKAIVNIEVKLNG